MTFTLRVNRNVPDLIDTIRCNVSFQHTYEGYKIFEVKTPNYVWKRINDNTTCYHISINITHVNDEKYLIIDNCLVTKVPDQFYISSSFMYYDRIVSLFTLTCIYWGII